MSDNPHAIKYYYNPARNPDNEQYPGVPHADITVHRYEGLPEDARAYLDDHVENRRGVYRLTKPRSEEQRAALKDATPEVEDDDPDDNAEVEAAADAPTDAPAPASDLGASDAEGSAGAGEAMLKAVGPAKGSTLTDEPSFRPTGKGKRAADNETTGETTTAEGQEG